jgi:hypothetical protein
MMDEEKKKQGQPTKYRSEYDKQAYKLCLLGATDKELGDFFEVDERTINNWKKEFPNFFQSIREGKELADMEVVNSLLESCHDRMIPSQQAFKVKNVYYNDEGKRIESEEVVVVDIKQGVQANDRSIQFWLKNRQPQKWRDKQEIKMEAEIGIVWEENKTYEAK